MKKTGFCLAVALASLTLPVVAANSWHFDGSHSGASFKVKAWMVTNVPGTMKGMTGKVVFDPKNIKAMQVDAHLDPNTIDTGEPKRDTHLKTADFFDVAKYPTIDFKSKKVVKVGGKYKLIGDLTMHGVTKEVALNMDAPSKEYKDAKGNEMVGTEAHTTINRADFGITWNKVIDQGGVMVGEPVDITLNVIVKKDAETASTETTK